MILYAFLCSVLSVISNWFYHYVCDHDVYPFPNFNGAAIEDWESISNLNPHFTGIIIIYAYLD